MYKNIYRIRIFLGAVLTVLAITGCTTLTYRDVQRDFNLAVQADNLQSVQPVPDNRALYEGIARDLSSDNYRFIKNELDRKLKANAYIILAISQWRSGQLTEAQETIEEAERDKSLEFAPRDRVLFDVIPHLVAEQDLMNRYKERGADNPEQVRISNNEYADIFEKNFPFIAEKLKDAARNVSGDTPPQIVIYVHYQRWRVLNNWRIVMNSLWDRTDFFSDESRGLRSSAKKRAGEFLGGVSMKEEISSTLLKIPENHPLRQLAELQMKL